MKFPDLIRPEFATTPIKITVYSNEIDEDGAPVTASSIETTCNYTASSQKILTTEQSVIQINGVARIPGDIVPDIPEISSGEVIIFGNKMRILNGKKVRNPDGTINYTRLELI